jgi:hypothetical protein
MNMLVGRGGIAGEGSGETAGLTVMWAIPEELNGEGIELVTPWSQLLTEAACADRSKAQQADVNHAMDK